MLEESMNDHCELLTQTSEALSTEGQGSHSTGPLQTTVVAPWNVPSWGHIFPVRVQRKGFERR